MTRPTIWSPFALMLLGLLPSAYGQRALVNQYCLGCHNQRLKTGGVSLEGLDPALAGDNTDIWERVLRQVSTGQMPPPKLPRPAAAALTAFTGNLEEALDRAAAVKPNPGAPMPHRLNRTEYSNAIRDLLAVDTKPGAMLPVDDSGSGFDNMADLLSLSPVLLERYLSAARTISRLAVGNLKMEPSEQNYGSRSRAQIREPDGDDLPFGSRGGIVFKHYFPLDAEYEIRIGMAGAPEGGAPANQLRLPVAAGLHTVAVTFLRESARPEIAVPARRFPGGPPAGPMNAGSSEMDLRLDGARIKRFQVPQRNGPPEAGIVTIAGPYQVSGRGQTPSRARIFVCKPAQASEDDVCATKILSNLSRRAFRRPVTDADLRPLLAFYKQGRAAGGDFEEGIQNALQAILVSPDFLFRIERDPRRAASGSLYRLGDYDLASRLSFFLWSSIPDDALLQLAAEGKLANAAVLKSQVGRMMADPKSDALISNFGGQWLYLRTLANARPDPDIFTGFDENLRHAFQRETELFVASIFREDRSVLELLDANYTFLNQRLAAHYKIPNVYGSHFRRVTLPDSKRGGLLGQGSVLTVTSYPNRTSVVMRGKWILDNLLGTPPPPPPTVVPELQPKAKDGRALSLRQAMQEHRANAICAGCHARMDPIGFALENFNGVGEWRDQDAAGPIDATGKLPDGVEFNGPSGLKKLLVERHKEEFIETFTEKLLTYALGRSVESQDRPAVRSMARMAARENYHISAFLSAIVESVPFQMRRASEK